MKRKERILSLIESTKDTGMTAQEVADTLGVLRNNASKDLNELVRDGHLQKSEGRPVRYYAAQGHGAAPSPLSAAPVASSLPEDDPFSPLIGYDRSLHHQVEQGKAGVLYPPNGLHTLIVGQTGVGKTLFAHLMFAYGKTMHRFAEDAPFVTFNCADYYTNPQLLLSHVFGHAKGAFTGAAQAKEGLVESADGGVLFLDEIHRLPPEGQEMIFYFMDTGTYGRLGETKRDRHARVLIIGATTEDPESALTKTFVRRIPNIIRIPPLADRTLDEKLDIIKMLFQKEAHGINKPIRIDIESIKSLLGSIEGGNVGQLKSNIKLACAQAFLNAIDNPDWMDVDFSMLPPGAKAGLLKLAADRKALADLSCIVTKPLTIFPDGTLPLPSTDDDSYNLYQIVSDKVEFLQQEGISGSYIRDAVSAEVNAYIKTLYDKQHPVEMTTRERLLKIIDPPLVDFADEITLYVQKELNRSYRNRFFYAFGLHLSAFLKRAKTKEAIPYPDLEGTLPSPKHLEIAAEIARRIKARYRVEVPRSEMEYIALLIESSQDDDLAEKIVILVAAHGKSAASSMVDTSTELFSGTDITLLAIDMPLDASPDAILEKAVALLKGVPCQKGVLILADMGSLLGLGPAIEDRLHIPVKTIDMVSTPLVLEAMRKAEIAGLDLSGIYESLRGFRGYENAVLAMQEKSGIIITICTTGQGAAEKLKALVEHSLRAASLSIPVIPIGMENLEECIHEIETTRHILAAVGLKKPAAQIPFIPLEDFIGGDGEAALLAILTGEPHTPGKKPSGVLKDLCDESLRAFLTYLNPEKVLPLLLRFCENVEKQLGSSYPTPQRVRLIVHAGCALERAVIHKPLEFQGNREAIDRKKLEALQQAGLLFRDTLHVQLNEDEYDFMTSIV